MTGPLLLSRDHLVKEEPDICGGLLSLYMPRCIDSVWHILEARLSWSLRPSLSSSQISTQHGAFSTGTRGVCWRLQGRSQDLESGGGGSAAERVISGARRKFLATPSF